jgi:tRNA A-37 threonylcarbamoyl transferase component Bud32
MEKETLPPEIVAGLNRMGLTDAQSIPGARLTGGVSSDIWRADLRTGPICVKRALGKLNVAADWRAPVERNRYEAQWMRVATRAAPGSAPTLLGQDDDSGALAMEFLPPDRFPLWKAQLLAGHVDPAFAAKVGAVLARIHAASAGDAAIEAAFPTDKIFHDIRLEPYLLATAARHPDRAAALQDLVAVTARTRIALVHGDVSPKNILAGPDGPVFLDAECAWWGDPAFDLAFCLNHLLLKCCAVPAASPAFLACFDALARAYLAGVTFPGLEARAARLLPGLLLARVDGKSPVEYISGEADRDLVRGVARRLLLTPVDGLAAVRSAWGDALAQ